MAELPAPLSRSLPISSSYHSSLALSLTYFLLDELSPQRAPFSPHSVVAAADTMAETGLSPPKQAPRPPVPFQQSKRGIALRVLDGRLLGCHLILVLFRRLGVPICLGPPLRLLTPRRFALDPPPTCGAPPSIDDGKAWSGTASNDVMSNRDDVSVVVKCLRLEAAEYLVRLSAGDGSWKHAAACTSSSAAQPLRPARVRQAN